MDYNSAVEIHDSTLERIESEGGALVAICSAYVHRSQGQPGFDAGTGWSQTLRLRFSRGRASGDLDKVPMQLLDGHLEVSGERFENLIPVPFFRTGPSRIELRGWNGVCVVIEGESAEATFVGEARYIEEFSAGEGGTP